MKTISTFTGCYSYLSNFYPAIVKLDGVLYPTVENAYQAAKTSADKRERFVTDTAPQAKRRGQTVKKRPDWDEVKLQVMHDLLKQKFKAGTELGTLLIGTRDAELIEGNYWGDTYWGVYHGEGQNHLGKLLMRVRQHLVEQGAA